MLSQISALSITKRLLVTCSVSLLVIELSLIFFFFIIALKKKGLHMSLFFKGPTIVLIICCNVYSLRSLKV